MELIKLLGFKGFIIYSDLRLLGYKKFIFDFILFFHFYRGGWGTGWQFLNVGDIRELGNTNIKQHYFLF